MSEEIWDEEEDGRNGIFAIMWDCNGLESVVRLPNPEDRTFALLKGVKPPEMPNINHWRLRARFNTHRNYEIYVITAQPGITEDDIQRMFESNPQVAADTIRRIGSCFHSDRDTKERAIT
jgi:hypothetical protein